MALPSGTSLKPFGNRLVQVMLDKDRDLLCSHFQRVECAKGQILIKPYVPIEHVYFPEGGLTSMAVSGWGCGATEIAVRGYEGLVGAPAILGTDQVPFQVSVHVRASMVRMRVQPLLQAMNQSPSLRNLLLRYTYVVLLQAAHAAYVSAQFKLEERLARWLLMAADRLGPQLPFTHDFLANMLGVRRPGVTQALHILEGEKLITAARGHIAIFNRPGLEARAGAAYGYAEAEYSRLIGPLRHDPSIASRIHGASNKFISS